MIHRGVSVLSCRNPHVPMESGLVFLWNREPWQEENPAGIYIRLSRCRSVPELGCCTHRKENDCVVILFNQPKLELVMDSSSNYSDK